jgi:hypothetical protein
MARAGIRLAKGEPLPQPETLDVGGEKFVKEFLQVAKAKRMAAAA